MRLIKRTDLQKIMNKFTIGGNWFNPEMVMLAKLCRIRFIEIPLNYKERVGKSMGTKNIFNAAVIGIGMIYLILKYRIKSLFYNYEM
jgi:hypothetical protein